MWSLQAPTWVYAAVIFFVSWAAGIGWAQMVKWYQGAPVSAVGLAITVAETVFVVLFSAWANNILCWYLYGRAFGGTASASQLIGNISKVHAAATMAITAAYFMLVVFPAKYPYFERLDFALDAAQTLVVAAVVLWYAWITYSTVRSLHILTRRKAAIVWVLGVSTWPLTFIVGFIIVAALVTIGARLLGISFLPPGYL
jgi:hypothetical protein